jgi:flavin reductase (DIM6/NTAB) family NADH-FMN oxidoreductase RutF
VRLGDSLATFECLLVDQTETSTHVVLIGIVKQVWTGAPRRPLLHAQGSYSRLLTLDETADAVK